MPIIVRSMHYQGEFHPAIEKRVIVVPVDKLDLRDEKAVHKIKLLAGARWTPQPPKDAGVSGLEEWGNGYVKISCEDFPKAQQNLKWVSDTLDKLVVSANVCHFRFSLVSVLICVCRTRRTHSRMCHSTCAISYRKSGRKRRATIPAGVLFSAQLSMTSRKNGSHNVLVHELYIYPRKLIGFIQARSLSYFRFRGVDKRSQCLCLLFCFPNCG